MMTLYSNIVEHFRRKELCKKSAIQQLRQIEQSSASLFSKRPMEGYCRGVDFYSRPQLTAAVSEAFRTFHNAHGYIPNIVSPVGFNEKIVWRKFFDELKVPESGNKLLTGKFIPEDIRQDISCPEIVWNSPRPVLPENSVIEDGAYYLKPNHGSNMLERVSYPIPDKQRRALERTCNSWLRRQFGLRDGEWWYNTFKSEILLEKDVASEKHSTAWMFFTFGEKIGYISAVKKSVDGTQTLWLDDNFKEMPIQNSFTEKIEILSLPDEVKSRMIHYAKQIGSGFKFVRIDFLTNDDGQIFLGEMTFAPNNGILKRPDSLDKYLSELWDIQ